VLATPRAELLKIRVNADNGSYPWAVPENVFVVGPGIPNLSQAMPFNLGELMNLSATRSTDSSGNNVITGLADSMLANLANNNAPTVRIQAPQTPRK